jgi:hypothetical protein
VGKEAGYVDREQRTPETAAELSGKALAAGTFRTG